MPFDTPTSTLTATPVQVYLLQEGWDWNVGSWQKSGTRTYLESLTDLPPPNVKVDLPKIGDSWDDNFLYVTCKNINTTYLPGNCARKFVLSYDNNTKYNSADDELLKTVDISGEMVSWEDKNGSWKWKSDKATPPARLQQPVFRSQSLCTIRLFHVVADFDEYLMKCMMVTNKVNSKVFHGFAPGMVLFEGGNFQEFKNRGDSKRWRVELSFVVRNVTDDFTVSEDPDNLERNGWNYILRDDTGEWDIPITNNTDKYPLYLSNDFKSLFENDLGEEENLYESHPIR